MSYQVSEHSDAFAQLIAKLHNFMNICQRALEHLLRNIVDLGTLHCQIICFHV